jgi:hypothetical protein
LAAVLACHAVVFYGALFFGETFAERDLKAYYRPAKALVRPLWRDSQGLPLWNPLFFSGQPFAANPEHEVFHPLTALFLVVPFEVAFRTQVLLPPLLGALAAYFLLRTLRRSRAASAFGAIAWGFGGYLLSTTNLLPILYAVAVVPAVLAFAIRCIRGGTAGDAAGLAASVGLVGLAGEPSTLLMLPVMILAGVLHEYARAKRVAAPLDWRRLALGLGLGITLGAATLVPGLHHASRTSRAGGLPLEVAGQWSLPPVRALELLSPHVLGHVDTVDETLYWGRDLYPEKRYPFLYSLYPGLSVSLLAILSSIKGFRRLWPWILLGAFGFVVAIGLHGPVFAALHRLPFVSNIRYPEKSALLFEIGLLVAASHGFDWVMGRALGLRRLLAVGFAVTLALGILAASALRGPRVPVFGFSPRLAEVASGDALRVGAVSAGCLLALVVLRLGRRRGAVALVGVTALDLALAGRALAPSVPVRDVAMPPPFLQPLLEHPPSGPLFHLAAEDVERGKAQGLAKPPEPAQWGIAMTLEADYDLTALRWSVFAREQFWEAVRKSPSLMPSLLARRGVGAVLKFRPGVSVRSGRLEMPRGETSPLELALRANPRPLAFAVDRVVRLRGRERWADAVVALGRDAATSVYVEGDQRVEVPERPAPAEVAVEVSRPGFIVLGVAAQGPGPSLVAVNQTWDDGWRATVDGVPVRLLRVDLALSAVEVQPGRHRVELVYRDPWVSWGLAVSLASLLALVGLAVIGRRPGSSSRLTGM